MSEPKYLIRTAPAKWVEPPGWLSACIQVQIEAGDLGYHCRRLRDACGNEQPHELAKLVAACKAVEKSAHKLAVLTEGFRCATCLDTGRVRSCPAEDEIECPACVPPPNEPAPESVVEVETDDIHDDAEYGEPVGAVSCQQVS